MVAELKVIFSDIDGVLNSVRSAVAFHLQDESGYRLSSQKGKDPKFDPIAVLLLKKIVEETNAKIVISSTWRKHNSIEDFHEIFDWYNWNTRGIIIGCTPVIHNVVRGVEIQKFIDDNNVGHYVILDDDSDMLPTQMHNFISVNNEYGLSFQHFEKATEILTHD